MKSLLKEAWTLAIETLCEMEKKGVSEKLALARTVNQLAITNSNSIRLASRLVYETVRRKNFIDKFINNVMKPRAIEKLDFAVLVFLRLYVYQTRVAKNWSKIDVKEAENITGLARAILGWKTLRVVEPILGFLLTEKPAIVFDGISDEERIGLQTFNATWFVKYCFKLFGRREAIKIFEANLHPPPVYIRLNNIKASEGKILKRLAEEKTNLEKVEQLSYTYKVLGTKQLLTKTASFKEGLFYIQDKASCFATQTANLKPRVIVMDICAAPGAKTTYLAQLMQNRGIIYSIDYSKRRMTVWKNEVARMGVKVAVPIIANACKPLPLAVKADVTVLDPPCTSTGAFGKLPSAKWRLTPRSITKMAEVQWQMINSCTKNVRPGGYLIYSTCSVTVEENEMLIEQFLKWHPEFSLAEIRPKIGLPGLREMEKCQRLYPHLHHCNGFFIAKLLRE